MDFLVLSPPVCTPSEPPSGAFILASALAGHGFETGFMDLSLEFYHRFLDQNAAVPGLRRGLDYLLQHDRYAPMLHRTATGAIHSAFKAYAKQHPGWTLTAMDLLPPQPVHQPQSLQKMLQSDDPFLPLWASTIPNLLHRHRPKKLLISIAYLSQLTAGISLVGFLERNGIPYIAGGSLLRSLHATGEGFALLKKAIKNIDVSNGSDLLPGMADVSFLNKMAYPQILCQKPYLSGRPVLPLTLSTGCYWSGCLFCPDRNMKYIQVQHQAFAQFLASIPGEIRDKKPVIHLLDSAMPKNCLRGFLPIAKSFGLGFYGFARPEKRLDKSFLREMADSGCLMLQLGVESGNDTLLSRFNKGIHPSEARRVLVNAAEEGIRTYVYLLFGLPGETASARADTFQLIRDHIDAVDFLNLSIFNLPKHCDLNHRAAEFDIVIDEYAEARQAIELYRPFTMNGTDASPRRLARQFIASHFSTDKRIRQAVLRTPKWFRAAHLAMMTLEGRN